MDTTTQCPKCKNNNPINYTTILEEKEKCLVCHEEYFFTKKQQKENEENHARKILKECIDPKKGIVIFQTSVSASGMSRAVSVYSHNLDSYLNYLIAKVLGYTLDKNEKLRLGGCGMDMHFHLAETLTSVLYTKEEQKKLKGNGQGCLPWKSIF